jgi:hypothetical protein
MPRGKQTPTEIREKCLSIVASTGNVSEASKQTGIPETTIRDWIKQNDEFAEYRANKKQEFIDKSWEIINKAQNLIDKRMNRAIEFENEIDALIDRIAIDDSLTDAEIKSIITKIKKLKLESATELSTVIGTLYDKQALANKEATSIVDGNIGMKKFEDL